VNDSRKQWDVFISHASEDKDSFVRPLADALGNLGISVWYDEYSLRLGDSLSRSIDKGLAESEFGLVVISPDFIAKPWPEYELRGLVAREIREGRVILPIWYRVTRDQILAFSPPLADKVALDTSRLAAEDVAIKLLREIRPDLYSKHPRDELQRLASGAALLELEAELEAAREELSEYRCPYCSAPMSIRIDAPTDPDQKDWDVRETFECGFQRFGGYVESPCPADPRFPKLDEYELRFQHSPDEPHWKWQCYPLGRTDMARRLYLSHGLGRTKDEAKQNVVEHYARVSRQSIR
jgi:hypothetical protein